MSAGPFSTILDTKIPSFEVLSLSSYGRNCSYFLEINKKHSVQIVKENSSGQNSLLTLTSKQKKSFSSHKLLLPPQYNESGPNVFAA